MNFGVGSHTCNPEYKEGFNGQTDHSFEINLLHFKWINRAYLYKIHRGYASRMSSENRKNNYGTQYTLGEIHIDTAFDYMKRFLNRESELA